MAGHNTSPLGAPYDPEQPGIMPTTPDSPGVGALAELSDPAISSRPSSAVDQADAHVQEIEMLPVDDSSTPVVLDMAPSTDVLPSAMSLPLASNAVTPSSGTPSAASTPGSYRSSIRRARVDDDDDERDRRHPSQRINSNSNSTTGTPTIPTFNRQSASNFIASNFPIFTHLTSSAGQPGGAPNPAGLYAHTQPGTSFSGFSSPSAVPIPNASSDINNSNSAPVASPDNLNSSTPTPGPSGSGTGLGLGSITGQSAHTSHSQSGQDQQRQNRANDENRPLVQLFDYGFSFVVDQDGARPVQIHQRRRQRGTTPNGSPLNPPTPPLAPIGSERHTQLRPQAQQQHPPPPQQTFPETQLPQMPLPPGAPPGGPGPNPDFTSIPMPPGLAANLANLFSIPFGVIGAGAGGFTFGLSPYEEKEDPERARKLIEGLEKVPVGLVRRLERVGKGGGVGEEGGKGGDAGCAVCWEKLLESDADAKTVTATVVEKVEDEDVEDDKMVIDSEGAEAVTPTTTKEEPSKSTLPTIVSLPCAHVFHADCLIPWFSRPKHTTCPTCRFNIDPENLTYVSAAARRRRREERERREQGSAADAAAGGADTNVDGDEGTRSEGNETPASSGANDEVGPQAQQEEDGDGNEEDGFNFNPAEGGEGFAGLLQMLNAQTQMNPGVPAPTAPTTGAGGDPTQPAPEPQGGQGQHMPMPWPMSMLAPFMPMPGPGAAPNPDHPNVQGNNSNPNTAPNPNANANPGGPQQPPQFRGFPPPGMGVGMQAFSIPVASGVMFGGRMPPPPRNGPGFEERRGNQRHLPNAAAVPPDGASAPPTHQGPPASAQPTGPNPGQGQGQRSVNLMADVLRVTVDMVFEGPRLGQGGRLGGQQEHTPDQDREGEENHVDGDDNNESDDGDDEEDDEEMPDLVDIVNDGGQLQELVDLIMNGGGQGPQDNVENGNDEAGANTAGNGERQPNPPQQHQAQEQPQPPAPHPLPRQPHEPHDAMPPANFQNLGGIHLASGTGRSLGEAITQMISSFMRGGPGQPQPSPGPAGQTAGQGQQPTADDGPQPQPQPGQAQGQNQGRPQGQQQHPPWQFIPVPFPPDFEFPMMSRRQHGTKRPWAPPPAPGPTLRQRIEKREREEGLRCHDVSCGLGPSDEEPFSPSEHGGGAAGAVGRKGPFQLVIVSNKEVGKEFGERNPACEHLFHSSCLVSAERVKLRGADAVAGEDGCVEVSCPVCRNVGCVRKEQWDEGVGALE